MATLEVQGLIDAICEMQEAIATPAGESPIKHAYDEFIGVALEFPCFLNLEESIDDIQVSGSHRHMEHRVSMHLLFSGDQKYATRSRRKWVQPVLDYFQGNTKLERHVQNVSLSRLERVSFEPYPINDVEHVAATFELFVRVDDGFGAGA